MIYEKTIGSNGGTAYLIIPKEALTWLDTKIGEKIILQDKEDNNKRYLIIYKK